MRKLGRVCSLSLLVAFAASAMAQNRTFIGSWKLDLSQSSAEGQDPSNPPQSIIGTYSKDSPEFGSWCVRIVDHDGNESSFCWSGPEDGSLHPVKDSSGNVLLMESMRKQPDGTTHRHGEHAPNGSSWDMVDRISDDGNTMVSEGTAVGKDGKETKMKLVYHRVVTESSGDSAKPH